MCVQGTLITKDSKIHLSHFLEDLQVNTQSRKAGSWIAWWSPWACLFAHLCELGFGMTGTHSRMFTAVAYLPDVMTGFDEQLSLMPHCFLSLLGIISAKAGRYSQRGYFTLELISITVDKTNMLWIWMSVVGLHLSLLLSSTCFWWHINERTSNELVNKIL